MVLGVGRKERARQAVLQSLQSEWRNRVNAGEKDVRGGKRAWLAELGTAMLFSCYIGLS